MPEPQPFEYRARVERWVDGDTVDLAIDLGFRTYMRDRFRLYGVNTNELRPRKDDFATEELRQAHIAKAKLAVDMVNELAPVGTHVLIKTHMEQGKYGRWLAEMYIEEKEEWIKEILIEGDLGVPYMES